MAPESTHILVTGADINHDALAPLSDAGIRIEIEPTVLELDRLIERLASSRYYLYGGIEAADKLDVEQFRMLHDAGLELIAFAGKGVRDFLDVPAAQAAGITVTNTPGAVEPSVAEFTLYLLLAALRHAPQRALGWLHENGFVAQDLPLSSSTALGDDLGDVTVGIVGLGDIGQLVARILVTGYGTKVIYYSRTRRPALEASLGLTYATPADIVMQADMVTLHLETNPETVQLVADIPFEDSASPIILVNTASERLVDPARLARLFAADRISYAAFDKIYPTSDLLATGLSGFVPDRLLVTNHAANMTRSAWLRMTESAVVNVLAHAAGNMPPNVVT
jgi:lactate dehydrogenase-like 2-hydroxyacid dehydrogenase